LRAKTGYLAALAVGLAVAFALLGQWQLRRADEAEARAAEFARLAVAPELEVIAALDAGAGLRYRRVALRGHYLPQTQVLIDNMTHAGVVGYHVLTPFVTTDGSVAVVNRGFVPAPPSRDDLPDVAVSTEERTVRGRIDTLPKPALRLEAERAGAAGAVRVLSFPERADLERAFGRPVAAYQILLDAAEPEGYGRAWEPDDDRAWRNLAYAGQWFALSVATLVAALGWALKSRLRTRGGG
jgi:surfeit locus 1 family protein